MDMLIKNIKQLVTPLGNKAKKGRDMKKLLIKNNIDMLIRNSVIREIDYSIDLPGDFEGSVITADELVATPGFVDPHTHIPFYGMRFEEFFLREKGADYMAIMEAGGGIVSTTRAVREAALDELVRFNSRFVKEMFEKGIVAFEGKSGYGLDTETEIKQLKALFKLEELCPQKIVKTFLGPHALPPEYSDYQAYMDHVNSEMLHQVSEAFEEPLFADIFCEKGVFTLEQSREYIKTAKKLGFDIRLHADEIAYLGGSELGAGEGARSVDHLIAITDEGIQALSDSDTIATLLPGTSFFLGKPYAPARKIIDADVAVALASDFNPGSCTINDPTFIAYLAVDRLKMEPEEILTAMTLNAAASLKLADEWGSLETGKLAGVLLWDIPDYRAVPYFPSHNMIDTVISPEKVMKLKGCV